MPPHSHRDQTRWGYNGFAVQPDAPNLQIARQRGVHLGAVKSTVPQEMWGEIIEKLEGFAQHREALNVGTDSLDDADDDAYDPTQFIDDDEF